MHPMLRPPFSPACFLQKFRDTRKPPLKFKTKYAVILPADLPNVLHSTCSVCLIQSLIFMHNRWIITRKH